MFPDRIFVGFREALFSGTGRSHVVALKATLWILVLGIALLTAWLCWVNRASEKVAVNVPSAAVLGAVGVLATLLFSLQTSSTHAEISTELLVNLKTKRTFVCRELPLIHEYTDPGVGRVIGAVVAADSTLTTFDPSTQSDDAQILTAEIDRTATLYCDAVTRLVIESIGETFGGSWDARVKRYGVGGKRGWEVGPGNEDRPAEGVTLEMADVLRLFKSPIFAVPPDPVWPFPRRVVLPPGSRLTVDKEEIPVLPRFHVRIENPFARVHITITTQGGDVGGLPAFARACGEHDPPGHYTRLLYETTVDAEFAAIRSGHPAMPVYRRWVD